MASIDPTLVTGPSSLGTPHVRSGDVSPAVGDTARRVDSVIQSLDIGLSERADPTPREVDTVRVMGMKLGAKTHTFDFSVKVKGVKAPLDESKLEQLALGCKRSLETAYKGKRAQLTKLQDKVDSFNERNKRVPKKLTKALEQVKNELEALDNLSTFSYRVKGDKPIVAVTGYTQEGKEIKMEVLLDARFSGAARAVHQSTEVLRNLKARKEAAIEDIQQKLQELTEINQHIATLRDAGQALPRGHTTLLRKAELETNEEAMLADLAQFEDQVSHMGKQLNALKDPRRHSIEISRQRKEGTADFVLTPRIKLEIRTDYTSEEVEASIEDEEAEDLPYHEVVYIPVMEPKNIVHFGGNVADNTDLLQEVSALADTAMKSKTDLGKAFQAQVAQKDKKKSAGPQATGGINAAQQRLLRDQQARMLQQQRLSQT